MSTLTELYEAAYLNDVIVDCIQLNKANSLSLMDNSGDCFIALDPFRLKSERTEIVQVAHELGHCMTGAFYNRYSKLDNISQKEYRANKWAVHKLIPFQKLQEAFDQGKIEKWELAEHFEVTEDFIDTVVQVYQNEGLLVG